MRTILLLPLIALTFASCGKHETEKGAVGTVAGATIGAALSSDNSKGEGTLIGALLGNYVGRKIGQAKDKKEVKVTHKKEVDQLKAQNQHLKRQLRKYCLRCHTHVDIAGAQSCHHCGSGLIQESFCSRCKTIFSPEAGYNYCPYCRVKTALRSR